MQTTTTVFFDIDGTLLDTDGAGRDAFARALTCVLGGDDDLRYVSFAGATDLNLLRKMTEDRGEEHCNDREQRFFDALERELRAVLNRDNVHIFEGVVELLKAISVRDDVQLGLITGNAEKTAEIKLAPHNLNRFFSFGAYGDEEACRRDIAGLAVERAKTRLPLGNRFGRMIIIGDTPSDIDAAKAIGASVLAVASGRFTEDALERAGADLVLTDLCDTARIMSWLFP